MTALHRAEDVAAEVVRRLKLCLPANGYETDLGAKVKQGRRHVDKSMLPYTALIEGDDILERIKVVSTYQVEQRYAVLAYRPCTVDDPNIAAHQAIRDIKRAIFTTNGRGDNTWGGTVKDVEYLGRDIGPRADGENFVLAIVEFAVTYVENLAQP